MRKLHILPKFADRWSHLYLEHGRLDRDASSLVFHDAEGRLDVPISQLGFVLLGPGTAVTHAAMKAMAENNCLVAWGGEQGVRLYAHSTGGTHSSRRLLRQAELCADPEARQAVVRRMYQKRFPENLSPEHSIEQVRGMEGARVRQAYERIAGEYGVQWQGRNYDQDNWYAGDPLNRALSAANSCLYGLCHAAILSAGYSPAIGFIHTGKMLSFVYDIADLYKTDISVPLAFSTVADGTEEVEKRIRHGARDFFYETKLMQHILPDIAEVLDAPDDLEELPGELEGRAVTVVDTTPERRISGQPQRQGKGRTVGDDPEKA